MYGLVNQAVKDLVVNKFGSSCWEDICRESDLPTNDFVSMQYYPDSITYQLVGSASRVLGVSGEAILREFGKHWVLYTAKEGYGAIMDMFGKDYKSCLQNLNSLHSRMGMTMPQLSPPKFKFTEIEPSVFDVEYHSQREGLCPMVIGLLEGLAEKFKVQVEISYSKKADINHFLIRTS